MDCEVEKNLCVLLEECIADTNSMQCFLSGFRYNFEVEDVWDSLKKFYKIYGDTPQVKLYVKKFLKYWFTYHCLDFRENRDIAIKVFTFTKKELKDDILCQQLKTIFLQESSIESPLIINIPPETSAFFPRTEYNFMFKVEEVANLMYSLNVNLFKLLPLDSTITENKSLLIQFSNHIRQHVASHILSPNTAKQRAKEIKFFIQVAKKVKAMFNYDLLFSIYSGLVCDPVQKLTRSWKRVSKREIKYIEELNTFFDSRNFYGNYGKEIKNITDVYIPMSQVLFHYLDCVMINKNFHITKIIGKFFRTLAKIRKIPININSNPYLKSIILLPSLTSEKLNELGYLRESVKLKGESSTPSESSSESDDYQQWSQSANDIDIEMSPRPFGTPRNKNYYGTTRISPRNIPRISLSESMFSTNRSKSSIIDRKPSRLNKSTSFYKKDNIIIDSKERSKSISEFKKQKSPRSYRDPMGSPRDNIQRPPITQYPCIKNLKLPPEGVNIYEISINNWTVHHVFRWLRDIDMEHYSTIFMGNKIDGNKLITLNRANLIKLGVEPKKDRKKILREIRLLNSNEIK